ncbi:DUF1295 domain-containing protein [Blastopirellula retiformator]|uniref:3-oxo-5-alpha-steroid 4-dehydrogenase n=1 Tax=Blastopirellula retiformator TaxID=2527970 RepID=A0A5C5V7J5_9BACT|nr:DUF1295 domain-containing protein [Blastopirellula retiformator]TWT34548.1 3-oxo-5-alpha-steroid 4-dehydrogenase [Blastopirellula retiformator]
MSTELSEVFLSSASVIAGFMTLVWVVSLWRKDASVVDVAWGLGFVLISWTSFGVSQHASLLLPLLTTLWGVRLSGYLAWRNHGKEEDYRYREMRDHWGAAFPWVSLVTVFALQGFVMWVVSLPIQAGIATEAPPMIWLAILGTAVWATGVFFEAVGDWQLAHFRATRADENAVLDRGLWRYTRHPNYFGDFLVWWGLYLVALAHGAPWWTAVGPAAMSVFLMKVSGVTLLEKSLSQKKPGYADYVARTNAFFPGMPQEK